MVRNSSRRPLRPVAGGADEEEEEDVDDEGVQHGHDGALRDGNARSLQLACGRRVKEEP